MENVLKAVVKHGCARIKSATKEYRAWNAMTSRCLNKTCDDYPTYGGRGISICDRWVGEHGFENFLSDMGKKPNGRYSLDRIDVNGNYEPSNCRWADDYQQASNRRNLRMIELNGECRHMSEWARMAGIPTSTMQARLTRGWPIDKAISTPLNKNKRLKKNSNLANAGGE